MPILTVIKDNKMAQIPFEGTPLVREVLVEGGFAVFSPCGGRGTCGKCEVRLSGAVSEPNEAEKKHGARLSCQAILLGDATAEIISEQEALAHIETKTGAVSVGDIDWEYGAAVDIGTTTVALKLFDSKGNCVGQAGAVNPQRSIAADVIGRIDAYLNGKGDHLCAQITECIDKLLFRACKTANISPEMVGSRITTGNTAMLYLYSNRSPESIARAPFKSETLFGQWVSDTYLPPCMNAFVGADITCAALASGMCDRDEISLMCDIGTNGEIALFKDGRLHVTSTAAGPAFEGAEISCGCGNVEGAIDKVWVEDGKLKARTIGNMPAIGICGSGLVSAVASFLELEYIDPTGAAECELEIYANGGSVTLTQGDIRAVQLAVGAIGAGIETVLSRSGTEVSEVEQLYLAGGFGNHLDTNCAARIGLIPYELAERSTAIGNAALTGAVMLLLDKSMIAKAEQIASDSKHIDLGGSSDFNNAFIEHMLFPEE